MAKNTRLFIINSQTTLRIIPELAIEIGFEEHIIFLQLEVFNFN